MTKKTEEKQAETTETTEIALATAETNLPMAAGMSFEEDAGAGIETADKDSFAIPFITMLQGLSPQLETVEGAKPGLLINTITDELYVKIRVIPCAYQRRFIRWAPRSSGGGFKGEHSPVEVETLSLPGMKLINGQYLMDVPEGANAFDGDGRPLYDHLSDTRNHFVLAQSASGSWQPALVSLSSTQIKASKRWVSRIQGVEMRNAAGKAFNPPSFSHIYELSSVKQENAKGKWYGWNIDMVGVVDDIDVYAKAKAFHASVAAGEIKVQQPDPIDAESREENQF